MPPTLTFPGVYIEEVPSGVRTITGVATSITAFVGFALRGPVNEPTRIQSFAEFERVFGGLWDGSTMSFAVQQFFLNGGGDALVVRAIHDSGTNAQQDTKATLTIGGFKLEAASEGSWGTNLRVRIDYDTRPIDTTIPGESATTLFNLSVKDMATGVVEAFFNVCTKPEHPRYVTQILEEQSNLIRVQPPGTVPAARPTDNSAVTLGDDPFDPTKTTSTAFGSDGHEGTGHAESDLVPGSPNKKGLYALDTADLFNLLVITPLARDGVLAVGSRDSASTYCHDHRALFVVDPDPSWNEPSDIAGGSALDTFIAGMTKENAALYFPRVRMTDALKDGATDLFPPSGAVAGVMARTDGTRGVWKAPAGLDATLAGVQELDVKLDDGGNGQLNPLGVNCLRAMPAAGPVVWGARTLAGNDRLASEWKYVPVRRTALFLEESLYRGTQWVVFEPNDEPLWAQIRLNVGAFMNNLFRQGAFAGTTPREAFFVKCDSETTTQDDVNLGIVNIIVGFAPLKPAEFVVIRLQQLAGQTGGA
jgi:phage tail sheath protein FI